MSRATFKTTNQTEAILSPSDHQRRLQVGVVLVHQVTLTRYNMYLLGTYQILRSSLTEFEPTDTASIFVNSECSYADSRHLHLHQELCQASGPSMPYYHITASANRTYDSTNEAPQKAPLPSASRLVNRAPQPPKKRIAKRPVAQLQEEIESSRPHPSESLFVGEEGGDGTWVNNPSMTRHTARNLLVEGAEHWKLTTVSPWLPGTTTF